MRIACRIPRATNTHSQYVIFIAIPLQKWLHEGASMLRYTYIACLAVLYAVYHDKITGNKNYESKAYFDLDTNISVT